MEDLIKALQILLKYGNPHFPTHCEHDKLNVLISAEDVSNVDIEKLEELGFFVDEADHIFSSFRYGSC